jgi:hypothetical protein
LKQKYNFYELKGKKLPDDINTPVHTMLIDDLQCPEISVALRNMESNKNCGEIQIFFKDKPKYLKIKTNFGMVEGYDLVTDHSTDRLDYSVSVHIKNSMLSMKKISNNELKDEDAIT